MILASHDLALHASVGGFNILFQTKVKWKRDLQFCTYIWFVIVRTIRTGTALPLILIYSFTVGPVAFRILD